MKFVRIPLLFLLSACAGCSVWNSEPLGLGGAEPARVQNGIAYSLPRVVVNAKLEAVKSTGAFSLDITDGGSAPDPKHRYILNYRPNPLYTDFVRASTNADGLLTGVSSTTKDQSASILLNLLGGANGAPIQTGPRPSNLNLEAGADTVLLLDIKLDPADPAEIADAERMINASIANYARNVQEDCDQLTNPKGDYAQRVEYLKDAIIAATADVAYYTSQKANIEREVQQRSEVLVGALDPKKPDIEGIQVNCRRPAQAVKDATEAYCQKVRSANKVAQHHAAATTRLKGLETTLATYEVSASCSAFARRTGLPRATIVVRPAPHSGSLYASTKSSQPAHRPAAKHACGSSVCYRPKLPYIIDYTLGSGNGSLALEMPNQAELMAIDIQRAFLVQKVQSLVFANGYLTSVKVEKESELLALSSIPLGVLSALTSSLQLHTEITNQQKNVTTKELELLQAQQSLAQEKAKQLESAAVVPSRSRAAISR